MPEVGSFDPEDTNRLFDQVWDPAHPSGSDAVTSAIEVDSLMADFAGVVSKDKVHVRCFEVTC